MSQGRRWSESRFAVMSNAEAHCERPVRDASATNQPTGPRCGGARG